jgi:hypothetical protein
VNPAVLVDSGLIVLLILCAKIRISERNTKLSTIFKYLKRDFPYCDLGKIPYNYRNNPGTFALSFTSKK